MDYKTAAKTFEAQWQWKPSSPNKECVFPYDLRYENDEFIQVSVPIDACATQPTDSKLVNKYIGVMMEGIDLGPSWVAYGKRLNNGDVTPFWHKQCYVLDGNHRLESRKQCGAKSINVIMPRSNYEIYMEKQNEQQNSQN